MAKGKINYPDDEEEKLEDLLLDDVEYDTMDDEE